MKRKLSKLSFWLNRHRFLIRIFLVLVLVFLIGFLAAGFLISYTTAENYVDAQSNYEYEKLSGDADKLSEKLLNISAAIMQTYQMDDERKSISTLLTSQNSDGNEAKIKKYIVQTVQSNPYISDIILINTGTKHVYYQSDILSQTFDKSYNWMKDSFSQRVMDSTNEVLFEECHKMPGVDIDREVCTFGHKIIDLASGNPGKMVGLILVQIPSSELFDPLDINNGKVEGKTFILNKENHILYTNKSNISNNAAINIYTKYKADDTSIYDRYLIRTKKLISWSGFTYVNIIDKTALFQENFRQILQDILPIMLGCIFICFIAINLAIYVIGKRIDRIVNYTRIVQSGNLKEQLAIDRNDEFTVIEQGLNTMTEELSHYIDEKYISDIALKKAQIRSLQLQMNPHFMFNTLENIRSSAIAADDWKSAAMISVLGDMYRWNLQKPDVVLLEDELDYLDYYMELQENRYQGRLQYMQKIPEEFWGCQIPKLTLQPVVENCLNHGFTPKMEPCIILLEAFLGDDEKTLNITVSDNGLGMSVDQVEELKQALHNKTESSTPYHIGMRNIHQRIQLLSGEKYGILIYSEEKAGTRIVIRIPYIVEESEEGAGYVSHSDSR